MHIDRLGKTLTMNNGLKATIIAYRNAKDIDIEFENGKIVCNKGYRDFSEGRVRCPDVFNRTNEAKTMNNGLTATIITYRNCDDIDIQFSNGEIICNKCYSDFRRGNVRCPLIIEYIDDYARVTNVNVQPNFSFLVDVEDLPLVEGRYWHSTGGYASAQKIGRLHRMIMQAKDDELVDHISGDTLDNRKCNLRLCTATGNARNRSLQSNNRSGFKGVSFDRDKGKWRACIAVGGKNIHLGVFHDKTEAAKAYNESAIKYYGEFAKLNNVR